MDDDSAYSSSFLAPALAKLERERGPRFVERLKQAIWRGENTHRVADHFAVSKALINALRLPTDARQELPPMRIIFSKQDKNAA